MLTFNRAIKQISELDAVNKPATRRRWFQNCTPLVMVQIYLEKHFSIADLSNDDFMSLTGITPPYLATGDSGPAIDEKMNQLLIEFCAAYGFEDVTEKNCSYYAAQIISVLVDYESSNGQ